ncbi:MAG: DUF1592 domain-containing protein [Acidobacteria bacterium]|nr:DUF1592 domain-containing protein [Bryobacteraceae bacterium CoA2 C42]
MKPAALLLLLATLPAPAQPLVPALCHGCHNAQNAQGGLDLAALPAHFADRAIRDRWIRLHDRVAKSEMPPPGVPFSTAQRAAMLAPLARLLHAADADDVRRHGRGPLRRLNRDEYEQNLRDLLQLPHLDIRDMLPEDREGHRFNKTADTLDMSRVQLLAYLDAAEAALRQAVASAPQPPPVTKFRAIGTALFPEKVTFGEREAMFFARHNQALDPKQLDSAKDDPTVEMALFRSAHWPYYGYPKHFVAPLPGPYRVRFSARAVRQLPGYTLAPAAQPVPMTFRARKPSGPDVSGDVRATGGIMDIPPVAREFEAIIHLREHETFEYSPLGLPVPLARNVDGGPPTYRYPPFPPSGQPGIAVQWLEVEGPLPPSPWPPPSHRVLFDDLGIAPAPAQPAAVARRLLHRFAARAAQEPVPPAALARFVDLVLARLNNGANFEQAMLAGYKAFLSSPHFLYLREPAPAGDHYPIATRLSHFLTNSRPDPPLTRLARQRRLRHATTLRAEATRLIASPGFSRFINNFTAYWLNLRHIRRDDPDIRLYPEYRFDNYLTESMEQETRAFFTAMIRDNLPASSVITADFVYANDRLASHYGLPPLSGSALRPVKLPPASPLGGLLTQAAILKVTANGTTTSPVLRGAWIMERLLGEPPPPPPAKVPAVEPDIRGAKTIRELLALHTRDASCANCHARFDPVGLALENFDILGAWRTRYRGIHEGDAVMGIDRAGHDFAYTLSSPVHPAGKLRNGQSFRDIRDLKAILAAQPRQLARNLLHQFTVYATGTPVRFSDRPAVEAILDAHAATGFRTRDLLVSLVQSPIFLGPSEGQPQP